MKKILRMLAIMLALVFAFSLFACDASEKSDANNDGKNTGSAGGFEEEGEMNGYPEIGPGNSTPNKPSGGDEAIEGEDNYFSPGTDMEVGGVIPGFPENSTGSEWETQGKDNSTEPSDPGEGETSETEATEGIEVEFITKPFVNAIDNNKSTFSADVDTASYTYFRKLVNSGYNFTLLRNSGSNFRVEEFINYFRYDVSQPTQGELFGVRTEMVPCPWNESSMLLRITLQAEEAVNTAGNNLIFLIDVSGSMSSRDKLPLLQRAFAYLVGNLGPCDTISIVTYSGQEAIVLDGCKGGDTATIMNAINSLKASGSTNGEAGLKMAYQIAEKHFIEGGNNRIIMASDGDLNVGISSADELTAFVEQKREQGVYLSILGFGTGNYRDANMEALADNGNGVYYYIDGESEAEKVFGTDLTGTLYTVANDVKLQLEFDTEFVEAYRLIGYDNRILDNEDFENDAKDAGEVGASHQVTVCYEVVFKPCDAYVVNFATLNVRYKNPGEPLSLLNTYRIGDKPLVPSNDDTRFIAAVVELATLLRNREYDGDISLESILEELDSLELTDAYKIEFRELVRTLNTRK